MTQNYIALYRKFRPQKLDEVVGQEVIKTSLSNSLKNNRFGHAYLFSGPRGTGKTSVAKIFAKAINCKNFEKGDACLECSSCISISNSEISDVIEIDAASNNGVDQIRDLREKARYRPTYCNYKVYIIDEVHMLSQSAFNALLKTLEEPPQHVVFILATTEIYKIPSTILSRCQRFDFKPISEDDIFSQLKNISKQDNIKIEDEAIKQIAYNAQGGLRDALSILDGAIVYSQDIITLDDIHKISGSVSEDDIILFFEDIINKKVEQALDKIDNIIKQGKDVSKIISTMIHVLKVVLTNKTTSNISDKFLKLSKKIELEQLYNYFDILNKLLQDIKWTNEKKIYLDVAVVTMIMSNKVETIENSIKINELSNQVNNLFTKINNMTIPQVNNTTSQSQNLENISLITTKDVENILNNASLKVKKEILDKIDNTIKEEKSNIKKYFDTFEIAASSETEVLLYTNSIDDAKKLYIEDVNAQLVEIFKKIYYNIKKIWIITYDKWEILKKDFAEQHSKKIKNIKLVNIDLGLTKYIHNNVDENSLYEQTKKIFGKDIVDKK